MEPPEPRLRRQGGPGWPALAGGLLLVFAGGLLRAQDAPSGGGEPLWRAPGRCEACHVEADWWVIKPPPAKDRFDHTATGFPLRFAHAEVECSDCHHKGLRALSTSCDNCHATPHANFRTFLCQDCHSERTWDVPRNFAFHERTRFPLTGVHASIQCEACHRQRRGEPAALLPTECFACHAPDYRTAVPDHVAAGFTACGSCHTTTTFDGGRFLHRSYVLAGQHAFADCTRCHSGAVFAGLANVGRNCIECHADDYVATTALSQRPGSGIPDHPGSGFSTDCVPCHPNADPVPITWDVLGNPGS